MSIRVRVAVLLLLAFAFGTAAVSAQAPYEIGLDAGLELEGNGTDLDVVRVSLPFASVRAARHVSTRVSVEVDASFSHVSFPDRVSSPSATRFGSSVAVLYHFGDDRSRPRLHAALGVPFQYVRATEGELTLSDSEVGLLAALGATIPASDRLAIRLQTRGIGWKGSRTSLSFLVGLSLFTS